MQPGARFSACLWDAKDLSAVGVGYQNVTPRSELADGRADLLAEVAGIFEGTSEGEPDEPLARSAARLCRLAGARSGGNPGLGRGGTTAEGEREQAAVLGWRPGSGIKVPETPGSARNPSRILRLSLVCWNST